MVSFDRQQEILHSPFDIDIHKQAFINYLELIILTDGTPVYAVPSHTIRLAEIYGKPMDDVYEDYIQERSGMDCIDWLCEKTGCVAVWYERCQGVPNESQRNTLQMLKDAGVYKPCYFGNSEHIHSLSPL